MRNPFLLLAIVISALHTPAAAIAPIEKTPSQHATFIENKGQVSDQYHHARADILFAGTINGMTYHLRNNGVSYQLRRVDSWQEQSSPHASAGEKIKLPAQSTVYRLDINWLNCNRDAAISKSGDITASNNYYLEHCPEGIFNVRSYKTVTYEHLYNGIDLKWYEKDGQLKYDYLVAAGADYKQIQLEFNGAEKITLTRSGELILKTPLGNIIEQAPLVIQNGRILRSAWIIKDNIVRFNIEAVDPTQPLIIDPIVRVWGTYFGGVNEEYGYCNAIDANDNIYLAGFTKSPAMVATSGAFQTVFGANGNYDAYLAKYNSNGVLQWSTYYGGSGSELGYGCAVDVSGNVYLAGYSSSSVSIASSGSYQSAMSGPQDAFLVQFNSSGIRQWATYYGGTGSEFGNACTTDASGNVYLTGYTTSSVGIATSGSYQTTLSGTTDAYLAKFNSAGVLQWGTYIGGTAAELGNSCATDASGNVYIAGESYSSGGIVTAAAHQTLYAGGGDVFLSKFNSSGVQQWATLYGGSSSDDGGYCATDASGNVYLAGFTSGGTGTIIATVGSHQTSFGGGTYDGFLAKFNSSGVRQWGTFYGGLASQDDIYACTTDAAGNVYISGFAPTGSAPAMTSAGAYQTTSNGPSDGFLAKFNSSGVRQWGTLYGGDDFDVIYCSAISTTTTGVIYMCGYTGSTVNIASPGSAQPAFGGYSDGFLVRLLDCPYPAAPVNTTSAANQTLCSGNTTTLSASGSGTVSWYATASSTLALGSGTNYPISNTLSTGSYTYYTEALTSCGPSASRTSVSFTINATPAISINSGTLCSGKSFTFTPSGASTYTINGGSAVVVNPTTTISYSITGTSTAGCITSSTTVSTLTVYTSPTVSASSASICAGQSVVITPTGALSYSINGGSNFTVNPSATALYSVTGTSTAGCSSTNTFVTTITVSALPSITVSSGTICSGQNFTLSPTGASSYTVNGGSNFTVNPGATSSYSITGTSTAGCTSSVATIATVTVYTTPSLSVNSGSICSGQNFTLVPSGASTYTINGGSVVIVSPTITTSYSVTGTSTAGCTSTTTAIANLSVSTSPTVTVNSGNICSGQIFSIVPTGASTYTVNGGSFTVSPSGTTSYSVTGTATNGCASNTAISGVTVNALPVISANSGSVCAGNSFVIVPSGAGSYTITGNSFTVSPAATSSYSITGTSTAGCLSSGAITLTVTVNALPVISANSGSVCAGQSFTITPSGANSYTITGNSFTVNPAATTSYSVTGTSTAGCLSPGPVVSTVTVNSIPVISVNSGSICTGHSFTIVPSGAATYTISGGATVVSPASNSSYTVSGTSAAGCTGTAQAISTVTVIGLPLVTASSAQNTICTGEQVILSSGGAVSYTWSTGESTMHISVSPTITTEYTVTGTAASGCTNTAVIEQLVSTCAGVTSLTGNTALVSVYPNPNSGNFTIETAEACDIHILNALGQVIATHQLNEGKNEVSLNDQAQGIYFIHLVQNGTAIKEIKVIKTE